MEWRCNRKTRQYVYVSVLGLAIILLYIVCVQNTQELYRKTENIDQSETSMDREKTNTHKRRFSKKHADSVYTYYGRFQERESELNKLRQKQELHESRRKSRHLPKCLIIGVRKGGTLALLRLLNIHPDIITPHSNEIHFFDDDTNYKKGIKFYRKQMPRCFDNKITTEKTPGYFHEEKVPERVHQMNSSIKLLLIVRNPVHRVISEYALNKIRYSKNGHYPDFKTFVTDTHGNINRELIAVNISTYHVHYTRWLNYFPKEQIHIVDGDNFAQTPHQELRTIETYLGIRHVISTENLVYDDAKGFFCPVYMDNKTECLPPGKGRKHPEIDSETLRKLQNYFDPLNKQFFAVSGRSFDWK